MQLKVSHVKKDGSKNVKRKRSPSENNHHIKFSRVDSSGKERDGERGRSSRGSNQESDRSRNEGSQRGGRRHEEDESGANEGRRAF